MDSNPGISLFQNSEFNKLEFNSPEPEELEAVEDEKRRNQEISELIKDAFDDLEHSRSINSSYFNSMNDCVNNSNKIPRPAVVLSPKKITKFISPYKSPGYDNHQQLEVLYQVRLREIEKLHNEVDNLKEISNREKGQLIDKINVLEAEKENAVILHSESQNALAETTRRLSNCEKELFELKKKFSETDNIKNKALHDLEIYKMNNREMEQRLVIAEKNNFKSDEKNFDNHLKEITSKHKCEINELQKEIRSVSAKLETKEKDCRKLELQLLEIQRLHDSVILEKSEIINKLTAKLEESQSQCHKLLTSSVNSDNGKLISHLKRQKAEIDSSTIQITALKKEKNHLLDLLEKQKKICLENQLSSEQIQKMEERIEQLCEENENLKKEHQSIPTKDDFFKFIEQNVTTEMKERNSKLETEMENILKESDRVKKMYIDVCAIKDKLLKENDAIGKELNEVKNEKLKLNELIKTLKSEKEVLNEKLISSQGVLKKQEKELENLVNKQEEQSRQTEEKHIHEMDSLKLALQNEFSKMEIFHQDQMSKLELECSKKLIELESNHKMHLLQLESSIKEEAMKVCTEEIESLSNTYKKQVEQLLLVNSDLEKEIKLKRSNCETLRTQLNELKLSKNGSNENAEVKRLQNELDNAEIKFNKAIVDWNEKLENTTEKYDKLRMDFQEIYKKYKKARKAATTLKDTLEERNRFIKDQHKQYLQIVKEIQNYLNDILEVKSEKCEDNELVPNDEFNALMGNINKKLQILKNRTIE